MARPSVSERNKEIRYWNQVLSGVDKNIHMPESLRGDALRGRLDKLPAPPEKKRFEASRLFSFQSVVSYAVMFALIVAVYYGMNISPAPLTEGQFAVPEAAPKAAADTDTGAVSSAAAAQPEAALSPYGDAALFGAPVPEMDAAVAESGLAGEPLPAARGAVLPDGFAADYPEDAANEAAPANSGANPAIGGATPAIGGGGEAVTLGEWNGYTLAWRENDPTDPDKLPYPVTLDIVESATSGLVCQIDIGEMTSVTDFLIEGDSLVLIGASGAGITVNSYSGYESFAPVLTGSAWQPGRYVTARFYQGAAYIASHSPAGEAPPEGIPVEALEGSLDEGTCYIGAVDVASGASGLLGLQNAGEEVNLFERHAYLSFTSPGLEEGSTEIRVATITLDGISLALERVD